MGRPVSRPINTSKPKEEITPATSDEINTGSLDNKYVSPQGLDGSLYRRIYIQETEPTDLQDGDIWINPNN